MRLDHVSYAAGPQGLAATVQRLGARIGAAFVDGGVHPRFGTRNFVLPLADGVYLEVVGVLDHPSADKAVFGQAVQRRTAAGGGWLGWVVAVDDIEPVEGRLGRTAVVGNRRRPDGVDLRWRQVGVRELLDAPHLPFFVQWQVPADQRPSRTGAAAIRLVGMEIAGDPLDVVAWLGQPPDHPLEGIDVEWVDADEPGVVAVRFATPHGIVRID